MKKHFIVFCNGFGVDKTDRGLFTDIANELSGIESRMSELNHIDEDSGTMTVRSLSEQAKIFSALMKDMQQQYPDSTIDVIAHSQGSIVVGLGMIKGIRKVLLVAPSLQSGAQRLISYFQKRPGTTINTEGISYLKRSDGSITKVPPEYWSDRTDVEPIELYNGLAKNSEVYLIIADDDVLERRNPTGITTGITVINLPGDHDFKGDSRKGLVTTVKEILGDRERKS